MTTTQSNFVLGSSTLFVVAVGRTRRGVTEWSISLRRLGANSVLSEQEKKGINIIDGYKLCSRSTFGNMEIRYFISSEGSSAPDLI
jgi:hypothetical protein